MSKKSSSKCPMGKIERNSYSYDKKSGIHIKVKKTCIKDKGKPGKGPKLIIIPKEDRGLLEPYGYTLSESYEKRIKALIKANKNEDNLKILRYINALRTLHKSNQRYFNKLDKDFKYLQEKYNKKID